MEDLLALFGGGDGGELGVAEVLPRQRVDVDEVAEPTEGVLQDVRRQRTRRADDEEAQRVADGVVQLVDGRLDRGQRHVHRVERGVDVRFARGRAGAVTVTVRNEFDDQPAV